MKHILFLILLTLTLGGCIAEQSRLSISMKKNATATKPAGVEKASVSNVQVINNQLVITGSGLNVVQNVKVNGNSIDKVFTIESITSTKIIANSLSLISFDVSKVFNLILSDANASATFAIDFSLCNATLNGKGFNCATPVADKDVLSYDAVSGTWKPRPASGLNYLGAFSASTNPATGPAIQPAGAYYIISVGGTIASTPFAVGDWLVSNGSSWQKIDNSTAVLSVFGRNGAITAQQGDYTLSLLGDVSFPTAPTIGKVLKFDGTNWVAGDDLSGGGAGSVTTTAIAAGAVTDAKIDTVSASKITGTLTSAQIADGSIVNADINAAAAIDYSKLNVPNSAITYAKLSIADGDIPAAKISGLPVLSTILAATITDGDTTHAPTGEAVYEALQLKIGTGGGTLSVGTINGVPTPLAPSEIVNKAYSDSADALRLLKAGDTMTGVLTLDNDLKVKGGSNYVTIKGSGSTANYNFTLPSSGGTNGYVLATDGNGVTSWVDVSFTEGNVLGTDLAGLNTGVNGPITATDTVLGAFGKMQYQVTDLKSKGLWDKTVNDISYSAGNVSIDKKLRLKSDNANYVEMLSPNALGATYTLTLPANDGNANQVLKTDGAGVLAWVDVNDATVQTFAKSVLPTCGAGEVLKSNGSTFSCVTDNAGAGAFSGTADRAVLTTAGGALGVSTTTSTELGYVSGVTSAIQTQLDAKQAALGFTPINKAGDSISSGNFVFSGTAALRAPDPIAATDVVNKQYLETFGQWTESGSDIYFLNKVGIGTSSLSSALTVGSTAVANNQILVQSLSPGIPSVLLQNSFNSLWMGLNSSGADSNGIPTNNAGFSVGNINMVFATGSTRTERMRLTNVGRLGIGTTNPQSVLDVNGAVRVGVDATACSGSIAGAMRFNTPNVEFCNGTSWVAFGVSNAAVASSQITDGTIIDADVSPAANIAATKLGTGVIDNTELNFLNGVTSSIQAQLDAKQATDATLTALAGYNTNGILVQTTADTFVGRSIAGTANRLTVANGDGVAGNPTVNIPTALLPSPVVGDVGKFLKATAADTSVWTALASSDVTTALGFTPINKAGDTLTTGTFTLSGAAVLRTPNPIAGTDVANKQYVDSYGQWIKNVNDISYTLGNVGIGTTSPTAVLTVNADSLYSSSAGFRIQSAASDATANILYMAPSAAGGYAAIQSYKNGTGVQPLLLNASGGNVGIGTNTPAGKLHINGSDNRAITIVPGTLNQTINFIHNDNGNVNADFANITGILDNGATGFNSGHLAFNTAPNSAGNPAPIERMRITEAGLIGIGTTTPTEKLHIYGSEVTAGFNRAALRLEEASSGVTWTVVAAGTGSAEGSGKFSINQQGLGSRLVINTSGNVGIGTTAPSEKLEVNGNVKAVAYLYTSDRRLKSNIVTIEDSLAKILSLRGVEFDWNNTGDHEIGLIAQEVEAVEPNLVTTSSVDGMKAVKYGNIVALLIEAIKAEHQIVLENQKAFALMQTGLKKLDQRTSKLEREVASLKEENAELKNELEKIKKYLKIK